MLGIRDTDARSPLIFAEAILPKEWRSYFPEKDWETISEFWNKQDYDVRDSPSDIDRLERIVRRYYRTQRGAEPNLGRLRLGAWLRMLHEVVQQHVDRLFKEAEAEEARTPEAEAVRRAEVQREAEAKKAADEAASEAKEKGFDQKSALIFGRGKDLAYSFDHGQKFWIRPDGTVDVGDGAERQTHIDMLGDYYRAELIEPALKKKKVERVVDLNDSASERLHRDLWKRGMAENIRGWFTGNQEDLALEALDLAGIERGLKILEKAKPEFLLVKQFVWDTPGSRGNVWVDEGEDALDAWTHRNDIRHRVSAAAKLSLEEIGELCQKVGNKFDVSHGDCGSFAIALKRFLGGGKVVIVTDKEPPHIPFHVFLEYQGMLFDGTGIQEPEAQAEISKEAYDLDETVFLSKPDHYILTRTEVHKDPEFYLDWLRHFSGNDIRHRVKAGTVELELDCANSEFHGEPKAKEMIAAWERWNQSHENKIRIKDPEDFDFDFLYKEGSLFVPGQEVESTVEELKRFNIGVDIRHRVKAARIDYEAEKKLPPDVIDAFYELGSLQRGDPESAMQDAQWALGGGVLSHLVEHLGDLTNRLTHDGTAMNKATMGLRALNHPYGFLKEHEENMVGNADYRKTPFEKYKAKVDQALAAYVKAHEALPVYNRVQWLARQIAIDIGKVDVDACKAHLEEFIRLSPTDARLEFEKDEDGKLLEYVPGRKVEALQAGISKKLYHRTSVYNLLEILNEDRFTLTTSAGTKSEKELEEKGKSYYLSTARSLSSAYFESFGNLSVTLVLDGEALAQNYSGKPVDYWGPEFRKVSPQKSETEDRIFSKESTIPEATSYIQEAHIFIYSKRYDSDDRDRRMLRRTLIALQSAGIPFWVYTDKEAYRWLKKSGASGLEDLDLTTEEPEEPRKHYEPNKYDQRDLGALLSLYKTDNPKSLSDEANKILRDAWSDYSIENQARRQASNLHNLKKSKDNKTVEEIVKALEESGAASIEDFTKQVLLKWRKLLEDAHKKESEVQKVAASLSREQLEAQGYTFELTMSDPPDGTIFAFFDSKRVGHLTFVGPDKGDYIFPQSTSVTLPHRRKGLASVMYSMAEEATGRHIEPSDSLSRDSQKFWERRLQEDPEALNKWKHRPTNEPLRNAATGAVEARRAIPLEDYEEQLKTAVDRVFDTIVYDYPSPDGPSKPMLRWGEEFVRNTDGGPTLHTLRVTPVGGGDEKEIEIYVHLMKLKPDYGGTMRYVAGGAKGNDKKTGAEIVMLRMNANRSVDELRDAEGTVKEAMALALRHETRHARQRKAPGRTPKQTPGSGEFEYSAYINDPAEIEAWMGDIVEQAAPWFSDNPIIDDSKEILSILDTHSDAWTRIKDDLTEENRKKILQAVAAAWAKWKEGQKVAASIIDYPRPQLSPLFWGTDNQMVPEARKAILDAANAVITGEGWSGAETWLQAVLLGSSIATQFYNDHSDVDVKLIVDAEKFKANNPQFAGLDDNGLIEKALDDIWKYNQKFSIAGHPFEFFVLPLTTMLEEHFPDRFDGLYDVTADIWVKRPTLVNPLTWNREAVVEAGKEDAERRAKEWDHQFGWLRQNLREAELVRDYLVAAPGQKEQEKRLDYLLSSISGLVLSLSKARDEVKAARRGSYKAHEKDLGRYYGFANATPEVIQMKLLSNWGYLATIEKLRDILKTEDGFRDAAAEDLPAIKRALFAPPFDMNGDAQAGKMTAAPQGIHMDHAVVLGHLVFASSVDVDVMTKGWLTSGGTLIPIEEGAWHADAAKQIFPDKWDEISKKYNSAVETAHEFMEFVAQQGWSRIGFDSDTLYVEPGDTKSTNWVLEKIGKENSEWVVGLTRLVVDTLEETFEVPVLEGEDALDAWKHRNDVRHQVRAAKENTVSGNPVGGKLGAFSASERDMAWVSPTGEFEEIHASTHTQWLLSNDPEGLAEHYSPAFPEEDQEDEYETAVFNSYLGQGWVRVLHVDNELFIQSSSPGAVARAEKALASIVKNKSEWAFSKGLIVNDAQIPVLEGEDALDAWKHRNDVRHRVKASTDEKYDKNKYWVRPDGSLLKVPYLWNHMQTIVEAPEYKSMAEAERGDNNDELASYGQRVWKQALSDGWARVRLDKGDVSLNVGDEDVVSRALAALPARKTTELRVDIGYVSPPIRVYEIPVLEGEDALDAWKHRNDVRHRVKSSLIFAEGESSFWVLPNGEVSAFSKYHGDAVWDMLSHEEQERFENLRGEPRLLLEEALNLGWVRILENFWHDTGRLHVETRTEESVAPALEAVGSRLPETPAYVLVDIMSGVVTTKASYEFPVLENEDALDAWKHRNDVRHRVKADGYKNFLISPVGEFVEIGSQQHNDAAQEQVQNQGMNTEMENWILKNPAPSGDDKYTWEYEAAMNMLFDLGWVRGGQSGGEIFLHNPRTKFDVVEALEAIPQKNKFGGGLTVDNAGESEHVDILEGEDAADAWKHRNDVRHRVSASGVTDASRVTLVFGRETKSGWLAPDGKFYEFPSDVSHLAWLIDNGGALLDDEIYEKVLATRGSDSDSTTFDAFDALFSSGWIRALSRDAFELSRKSLPQMKAHLRSTRSTADREDIIYIDFPGEPSLEIPLKEVLQLSVSGAFNDRYKEVNEAAQEAAKGAALSDAETAQAAGDLQRLARDARTENELNNVEKRLPKLTFTEV